MNQFESLSRRAIQAPESGIVAVVNHGRLKPGLIPLWAGEGDEKTPDFIARPAAEALLGGETFYTWQRGIPELRQALADYHDRLFGKQLPLDAFCVTGSGMQAIKIAIEAVVDPGDEVIQLTPAWPNFAAALGMSGGVSVAAPLDYADGRWSLDPERLAAAITPKTRAIFFNSPSTFLVILNDIPKYRSDLLIYKGVFDVFRHVFIEIKYIAFFTSCVALANNL